MSFDSPMTFSNRDADDLAEKTVALIEDQLLISGVGVPECGVHVSLLALLDPAGQSRVVPYLRL
jgi:hypothetical protein